MSITTNNETYLTVAESAQLIGRANQTIYQFWKKWGWQPFRYGQTLLFRQDQIQSWLESQITEDEIKEEASSYLKPKKK